MRRAVLTKNGMVMRGSERKPYGERDILVETIGCGICEGDVVEDKPREDLCGRELRLGHEGIERVVAADHVGLIPAHQQTECDRWLFAGRLHAYLSSTRSPPQAIFIRCFVPF
jgi:hypothetical protein